MSLVPGSCHGPNKNTPCDAECLLFDAADKDGHVCTCGHPKNRHPSAAPVATDAVLLDWSENSNHSAALEEYKNISKCTMSTPEIDAIAAKITLISAPTDGPPPFIFLAGSSGMGKTQTALTIRSRFAAEGRSVHYFLARSVVPTDQPVYHAFSHISAAFHACYTKDLKHLNSIDASEYHCGTLQTTRLFTYGFAEALIQKSKNPDMQLYTILQRSHRDVRNALGGNPPPIIIIDEFLINPVYPGSDPRSDDRPTRLIRNVFRSLSFVLIIAGTESKAANLIEGAKSSRVANNLKRPWSFVFGSLPVVNLDALGWSPQQQSDFFSSLTTVLQKSRPLFATFAIDFVNENASIAVSSIVDAIDEIAGHVAREAVKVKGIFKNLFGRLGQLHLFENLSYAKVDGNTRENIPSAAFINSHFANLCDPRDFTLNLDGSINETNTEWSGKSTFPSPAEDILLHLSVAGGKRFSPFQDKANNPCSVRQFYKELVNSHIVISTKCSSENAAQASNSGMLMENIATICICVSSRVGGISGVLVPDFIRQLYFHVFDTSQSESRSLSCDLLGALNQKYVPYLSVPNQEWPEWITSLPGSRFGKLSRPRNATMIDIHTQPPPSQHADNCLLTGECKDWQAPLPKSVIDGIIEKIPSVSNLHLVFTNKLQQSYNKEEPKLNETKKYLVLQQSGIVLMPGISQPQGETTGVVLFVLFGASGSCFE